MSVSAKYAVSAFGLSKSYGNTPAIRDVSFDIHQGELFGFIGPDGAGKTTLFRILTTLLLADSGVATVLGREVVTEYRALRKLIGYMPGRFSLYTDLTVRENLNFFASIFGTTVEENYDLIEDIYSHIELFEDRRAGALSGGMKQKLALSCALIHRPDILFLDEPTTGVDAVSRREFWDMLFKLKSAGLTIIVSTPYMDEATRCDRIALIQDGEILKIDTPEALMDAFEHPLFAVYGKNKFELLTTLRKFPAARSVFPFGESVHVTIDSGYENGTIDAGKVGEFLSASGIEARVEAIRPTVEDVFLDLSVDGEYSGAGSHVGGSGSAGVKMSGSTIE
jgi:ABC-type multidrug transport system ATPase subunit